MKKTYTCATEVETEALGGKLALSLKAGSFVALNGGLGAGKTAFVRGMAAALGYERVSSPTFTIVHEYPTNPPIFHFDCYRLKCAEDLEGIGFDDYLSRSGIIAMEWAQNVQGALTGISAADVTLVSFEQPGDGSRIITVGDDD